MNDGYHCVAAALFKSGTSEESSMWGYRTGLLSHSCPMQDSSCSTVVGLFARLFISCCTRCFLLEKGLDCRQTGSALEFSPAKPCCWDGCSKQCHPGVALKFLCFSALTMPAQCENWLFLWNFFIPMAPLLFISSYSHTVV